MVDALFPIAQIGAQIGAPIAHAKKSFAQSKKGVYHCVVNHCKGVNHGNLDLRTTKR